MGWLYYNSHCYTKRGAVDRKAECDKICTGEYDKKNADGTVTHFKNRVLKSAMVGRVWYGAVEFTKNGELDVVGALVLLTSSDSKHGWNFGYKYMDETGGPFDRECPVSILKCLTSIEEMKRKGHHVGYAEEWRRDCYANAERKAKDAKAAVPSCMTVNYRGGWVCSSQFYRNHNPYSGIRYHRNKCKREAVLAFVEKHCPMMALVKSKAKAA